MGSSSCDSVKYKQDAFKLLIRNLEIFNESSLALGALAETKKTLTQKQNLI